MNWIETLLGRTRASILGLLRPSRRTITELASATGITGNAVRGHLAALRSDGLVREAGTAASTGGKPAQLYDLTPEAEELFPKAYATVLGEMVRTLRERDGHEATAALLRDVGRRAGGIPARAGEGAAAVAAAAEALRSLGGEVSVAPLEGGWEIRGAGCPLSRVVAADPDACAIAQGLIAGITGAHVTECCDRSEARARCRFRVEHARPAEGTG